MRDRLTSAVRIPVIASGGAGTIQHFVDAVQQGKADAVLAASLFHFRELRIADIKKAFVENGIPARYES